MAQKWAVLVQVMTLTVRFEDVRLGLFTLVIDYTLRRAGLICLANQDRLDGQGRWRSELPASPIS